MHDAHLARTYASSTKPSGDRASGSCLRRARGCVGFFCASVALLACQGVQRLAAVQVQPPAPQEQFARDDDVRPAAPGPGGAGDGVPAEVLKAAVARSNEASFALWHALRESQGHEQRANFVASPYSIRSALGLVYLASVPGEGRRGLREAMRYPERNEDMDTRLLDRSVERSSDARFESSNAVWVTSRDALSPTYLDAVSRTLVAEVHPIDFAANPARAQQRINEWVSERTRGTIPEILHGEVITEETRAALVNAVYFFGKWASQFKPRLTAPKPFRTADGSTINTKMMAGALCYAVFEKEYQAGFAGYSDTSLEFVVVMPTHWQTFRWDVETFRRVRKALRSPSEVEFELPRFSLRSRTPLAGVVGELGVGLHDPQLLAGLLASGEPLTISHAIHEAFIQVDETSTEAAAATAFGAIKVHEIDRGVLRLDRPFYFMLVDHRTGLITFMGQATEPAAAEDRASDRP